MRCVVSACVSTKKPVGEVVWVIVGVARRGACFVVCATRIPGRNVTAKQVVESRSAAGSFMEFECSKAATRRWVRTSHPTERCINGTYQEGQHTPGACRHAKQTNRKARRTRPLEEDSRWDGPPRAETSA